MSTKSEIEILELPATDPRLRHLIATHAAYCARHTPEGSGHAIPVAAADDDTLRYWVALREGKALGCVAMKPLGGDHAEIKTLHVLRVARGQGIGESLVREAMTVARQGGIRRMSLETGRGDGFAASRRLYAAIGFSACPAFGPYAQDPFSYCMTRTL